MKYITLFLFFISILQADNILEKNIEKLFESILVFDVKQKTENSNLNLLNKPTEISEDVLLKYNNRDKNIKLLLSSIFIEKEYYINNKIYDDYINTLTKTMEANRDLNYELAYERDEILLNTYNLKIVFFNYLNSIIDNRKYYNTKETYLADYKNISNYIQNIDIKKYKNRIDTYKVKNNITEEYILNYNKYKENIDKYNIILNYINSHMNTIIKSNIYFEYISLSYWIDYINNISIIENINIYIKYYLKSDFASIIMAILIFTLINFARIIVLPIIVKILENNIKDDNYSNKYWMNSLREPIKYIMFVLSFQVIFYILITDKNSLHDALSITNAGYMLVFFYLIHKMFDEWIDIYSDNFFKKYENIRIEVVNFFGKIFRILLLIAILIYLLVEFGFDVKAIVGGLGVGGIAIALGAKDTLANFFGSINIMLDNSFSHGDWIVTNKYEGTVVEIKMRTTTIRTFKNGLVTIPNSELANNSILNWNKRVVGRRIDMILSLTYQSNIEDIQKAVKEIRAMLENHKDIASENKKYNNINKKSSKLTKKEDEYGVKKTLLVHTDKLSASSIDIMIYSFAKTVEWSKWLEVKEDVIYNIMTIIESNGLEFAYPTQTVNLIKE